MEPFWQWFFYVIFFVAVLFVLLVVAGVIRAEALPGVQIIYE